VRTARPAAIGGLLMSLALGACTSTPASTPTPAPAAVATSVTPATMPTAPKQAPVVVLDPGHNGRNGSSPAAINRPVPDGRGGTKPCNSTGTATNAGYPEHAFNWDVATRVQQKLVAAGVRVVMTRPDDIGVGPCVDVRGHPGEKANAAAVVSIHADGSAARNSGFHVAFSDPPLNASQKEPAHALAVDVRDAMRGGGFRDSDYIGRAGLSPRTDLAGLSLSTRPTVLVECANMRNAAEAALVTSTQGRERYAAAITAGILAFIRIGR